LEEGCAPAAVASAAMDAAKNIFPNMVFT